MKKIRKQLITLAFTLAFILIFSGTVSAAEWTVGPNSTYNYTAIQAAVDGSSNEDTITVYPNGTSTYCENVVVNKNLTIKANSSNTIVKGSFTITSSGSGSTIQGFTINKATNTLIFSENFDSVTAPALPSGWAVQDVSGTSGNWATSASTVHPSGQPAHSGSNLAYFNSFTAYTGNSARLYRTTGLDLSDLSNALVSFWMYHDTSWSNQDSVQLQISTNGGANWYSVGPVIYRYDGTYGWREHIIDISSYTGSGMTDVRIGLEGYSNWGNDCHIDDIIVRSSTAPATNGIYLNSASGCTINGNTINGFDNGNGIYLSSANSSTITGNIITSCITGINLYGSNNHLISGNNVSNNNNVAIYVQEYSTRNNIINNIANNNGHGIYLNRFCDNNNIDGNTVTNSVYDGITMGASTGNTIKSNIMSYNGGYGFWSNYYGNAIIGNNIFHNLRGIGLNNYLNNGLAETIQFNRIFNNAEYNLIYLQPATHGIPIATYNWWGTNSQTAIASKISGTVNYSPWLVMTINAAPNPINNGENSLITVSFNNYSSDGTTYTSFDPATGHIPDGPITLNVPWGSFTSSGISHSFTADTVNGVMTATFFANEGAVNQSFNPVRVNAIADGYTTNNAEAAYITINKVANFAFDKTIISPVKGKYNVGDVITFAITVKNIGFDTMTNVSIEDELLDLLGFISASGIYSFNATENTVTWLLPDLAANDTFTVNLTAKVLPKAAGNTVINKANIYNDLEPTHIYDKVEFYVPKSNLYIKITANKNKPKVNETFLLTYKLGNKGPDPAENVTITIPLPKGFQLTNIHGDGNWTYNKATNTITWTLKNVPVGDPYLYVSGRFTRAGVYVFGASITSDTYTINTEGTPITINTIAVANAQTVPMQKTGIPIAGLVLAVLALFSGLATSKRK